MLKWFSIIAILAITFSNVQPPRVQAQGGDGLKRQLNAESGRVSFIGPENGRVFTSAKALGLGQGLANHPADPAMALAERFGPEFGLKDPGRELAEMKKNQDGSGKVSVKYQQKYAGVPVMAGELSVNTDEQGNLYSINGEVSPGLDQSTQTTIDPQQARQTALRSMAKWYEKSSEDFTATDPELWIYDESLLQPSTRPVELTWRMEVTSADGSIPVRELVLVDAQRGGISLHFNQIDTAWKTSNQSDDLPPTATPGPSQPAEPSMSTDGLGSVDSSPPLVELPPASNIQAADLTGTWYLATTGSDANLCTDPNAPCRTINAAIGKAASGGLVKVAHRIYTGSGSRVLSLICLDGLRSVRQTMA